MLIPDSAAKLNERRESACVNVAPGDVYHPPAPGAGVERALQEIHAAQNQYPAC